LVDRTGNVKDSNRKNSLWKCIWYLCIGGVVPCFGDKNALQLAKDCFTWLEKHAHDPVLKGYYQNLLPDGTP
jgi:mannobiose 2-epimerase